MTNSSTVIKVNGKLAYNLSRIMKRANALVRVGQKDNMSEALKAVWGEAKDKMSNELYKQEVKDFQETNKIESPTMQGDFSIDRDFTGKKYKNVN
ncbi:MAG: hypothetical protein GY928_14735 [Colwellia sp.]|nr:hypothetical protein [Colwellia sp.]